MLGDRELVTISKFMAYVLRHNPGAIGLTLDASGWADVEELIACANARGRGLSRAVVEEIVARNDKKRFVLSDDGRRIRAAQGHSVKVDLQLDPREPPEILFHGTHERALGSIRAAGLRPGSRTHVHLSPDIETAEKVGARRGKPIVLRIRALDMWKAGHTFYRAENGVWLTAAVPAEFVEFP